MAQKIKVTTDVLGKEKFYFLVTGQVDKKAKVSPGALYLNGEAGEVIEATITIVPDPKNELSILSIEQKTDSGLITTLVAPDKKEDPWQVLVSATSDKKAHIFETLKLKTDNPREPVIFVKVSASFSKGI